MPSKHFKIDINFLDSATVPIEKNYSSQPSTSANQPNTIASFSSSALVEENVDSEKSNLGVPIPSTSRNSRKRSFEAFTSRKKSKYVDFTQQTTISSSVDSPRNNRIRETIFAEYIKKSACLNIFKETSFIAIREYTVYT